MSRDHRPSPDRKLNGANTPVPALSLLGDERYSVMVTSAGSGVSRSRGIAISRWRNDPTRDAHGQWCYLMNVGTGKVWSAGHQPVCAPNQSYEARLGGNAATIRRRDDDIETFTEIVALPDGSGEARRISVTNHSDTDVEIELTSYQEVVLAPAVSDRGHRAFGNLFVQTEWLPESSAILAMRRPRSAIDAPTWCGHAVAVTGAKAPGVSCETDRARFIGRGGSTQLPVAMVSPGDLGGTTGPVLDPVIALRTTLAVKAGQTARAVFTTFTAADRDETVARASLYSDSDTAERAVELAIAAGDTVAHEMGLEPAKTDAYHTLAANLIYGTGHIPAGTRDDLLALGLTGELPLLLAKLNAPADLGGAGHVVAMHEYWRRKGIASDLVFICRSAGLEQSILEIAKPMAAEVSDTDLPGKSERVFVHNEASLGPAAVALLDSLARVSIDCAQDWSRP